MILSDFLESDLRRFIQPFNVLCLDFYHFVASTSRGRVDLRFERTQLYAVHFLTPWALAIDSVDNRMYGRRLVPFFTSRVSRSTDRF